MGHGVVALAVLITLAAALSEMAWLVVMYEHTGEKDGGAVMYEHAGEMGALQSRSAGLQIEIGSPFVCGPDTHIWLLLPVYFYTSRVTKSPSQRLLHGPLRSTRMVPPVVRWDTGIHVAVSDCAHNP